MLLHLGSCRGFKVWDTVDSRHDPHLDGVGIPMATEDLGVEGGRGRRDKQSLPANATWQRMCI